ncbi:MAG: DUF4058 family protein [Planctomycetia bacterium]|nr:DUF4058 family protein [Planctomycetia bacterium]
MPSPFPGMNPFLENQEWSDFHTTFNTVLRELLLPQVRPRYAVRVERRVYVEHPAAENGSYLRSDVAVLVPESGAAGTVARTAGTALAPVACLLPMPQEQRETYLVVRESETLEVVTVIETLSPANKRRGGDGRSEYLAKRDQVLSSYSHLVEIDLLRGGERLPLVGTVPAGDYYAIVSRKDRRPWCEVFAWTLRQKLPVIPIPLKKGDPDVFVDLQAALKTADDRAEYDLTLNYDRPLAPPLSDEDAAWMKTVLAGRGKSA